MKKPNSVTKSTVVFIVFLMSLIGVAKGAPDDFSYTAFQEDTAASSNNNVASSEVQATDFLTEDIGFEVFPQALTPNQNQLTQQRITNEFYYIILLSAVALISLFVVLNFLKSHGQCPRDIVNAAGLILIIFGTIILVLVVDTTEQLTAAIGVLGAIAGYLFGTIQSDKQSKAE